MTKHRGMRILAAAAAAAVLLDGGACALAAPSDAQKCEALKHAAIARFAQCRSKADATHAKTLDATRRSTAYANCASKLDDAYVKAEAAYPGDCPTESDRAAVEGFVEACTETTRDWTSGALDAPLVFGRFAATGQTSCASTTGAPIACAGTGQDGELLRGAALSFTDNGDGTITDQNTGLTWEALSDDGGIHDKDATYSWDDAVLVKIATLNAQSFAGHDDWRLPNVRELQSIVSYATYGPAVQAAFHSGCSTGCALPSCSCTPSSGPAWSSTTHPGALGYAWTVSFGDGQQSAYGKLGPLGVRAVRGGN